MPAPTYLVALASPIRCALCGLRRRWLVATRQHGTQHLTCACGAAVVR